MSDDAAVQGSTESAAADANVSTDALDDASKAGETEAGVLDGDDESGEGEGAAEAAKEEPQEVPEKYEYKVPEGMPLDAKAIEAFEPIFKDLKLPQAAVDKIVQAYAAKQQADADGITKFYADMKAECLKIPKEDLALAKRGRSIVPDDVVAPFKNDEYLKNNPVVVRLFQAAGKLASDAKFREGGTGAPGPMTEEDRAKKRYPTMK